MSRAGRRSALAGVRKAAGHTQESLAAALDLDRSTIVRWESGDHAPLPYIRRRLARLLGQSLAQLRELIDEDSGIRVGQPAAETRIGDAEAAFDWLDQHTGWLPGTSRRKVTSRLAALDGRALTDRNGLRAKAGRSEIARALSDYYGDRYPGDLGTYRACCDGRELETSIVTRPDWLDLACTLGSRDDRLVIADSAPSYHVELDDIAAESAVRRLVDVVASDVRLSNAPIYRLLDADIRQGSIRGRVGQAQFSEYALTMDLLEGELLDGVVGGASESGFLPLRDRYLPRPDSVLDMSGRLCAGGVVALCAIARPADAHRGAADFLLLVQERSGHVLNAAHRLAVIPKGFHKPFADYRADSQVSATLRRKLEEELFGRSDIDSTVSRHLVVAPMHPTRLSEPMGWLSANSDAVRMECAGFGLNLVSGNYEFASLVIIDDESFWHQYGGHIEANWEAAGLRIYSSLDRELVAELIADERWSNEGLFAFLQGLRRLSVLGGNRVRLPVIE